jgi:hypothetical protein
MAVVEAKIQTVEDIWPIIYLTSPAFRRILVTPLLIVPGNPWDGKYIIARDWSR